MVSQIVGAGAPLLDEHLAQKSQTEERARREKLQDILTLNDDRERGEHLHGFIAKLLIDAGENPADVPGKGAVVQDVPLSHLVALIGCAVQLVRNRADLANFEYALRRAQKS